MKRFFQWYSRTYRVLPFSTAFVTCYLKGSVADAITQTKLESKSSNFGEVRNNGNWFDRIDWMRNWRFSMFSGLYCGCIHHLIYNLLYSALFPASTWTSAIIKTVVDSFVHIPFSYFPVYFAMKSMFLGKSPLDGLKSYWYDEIWTVLPIYWKVWIPVLVFLFYFIPYELRVGTIAALSLFWLILLSYLSPMTDKQQTRQLEKNIQIVQTKNDQEKQIQS